MAPLECTHCPKCHGLQNREGVGLKPRYLPPATCVRTGLRPLSGCKPGNLVTVTSEVWALAQDSNQPEIHKNQSTSQYSCPGPQAKPVEHSPTHMPHCQPKAGVSLSWLRIWPDHPDTSRTGRLTPSLCESWALNPHKHLVDGLKDPVCPAWATPCLPQSQASS